MLMVRLVLDLLTRRAAGGHVPILASVASWNPADQDLRGWLSAQLLIDHPALADPPPTGMAEPTQAEALLTSGLVLPILDGLDEIREEIRGSAISRINDALWPGEHLVLTCRTHQYQAAIRPKGGIEVTLRAAAAVQLRPLDADAVRGYLCNDAAGPGARARWDPVLATLGTSTPTGQAPRTPLMIGLARDIYNPRPGELTGAARDPAELCDPALADRTAVESVLFDAFVPAAYRHNPIRSWKPQDAKRWLVFLARHLEDTIASPDLAWWQLPLAVPGFALAAGLMLGAMTGVVAGILAWALLGPEVGPMAGIVSGVVYGALIWVLTGSAFVRRKPLPRPVRGIRWRPPLPRQLALWALAAVGIGATAGAIAATTDKSVGLVAAAAFGVWALTVLMIWTTHQRSTSLDLRSATSPPVALAGDRSTGIVVGVGAGVVFGTWAGFVVGSGPGAWAGIICGAGAAVLLGVICSFLRPPVLSSRAAARPQPGGRPLPGHGAGTPPAALASAASPGRPPGCRPEPLTGGGPRDSDQHQPRRPGKEKGQGNPSSRTSATRQGLFRGPCRAGSAEPSERPWRYGPYNPGARSTWTPRSSASWADRRNRTSGCCTPRSSATASSSPGRTASRRPGASCSRCSTTRPTSAPTRGDHGDPTTRKPGSAVSPAGSSHGCPRTAEPPDR
jgi:hypothetical protein